MALNLGKITARLNSITDEFQGKVVQVGIPTGKQYEDGTMVAAVAAQNEFGAPEARIPARPFFAPTIAAKKDEWVKIMEMGAKRVVDGSGSAEDALDAVGLTAALQIQETIANIHDPKLAEYTLAMRKAKGNTSIKPLVDSGYMISQITHAVNKEGSEFTK